MTLATDKDDPRTCEECEADLSFLPDDFRYCPQCGNQLNNGAVESEDEEDGDIPGVAGDEEDDEEDGED